MTAQPADPAPVPVLDAVVRMADDPRPAGSFPYGSPWLRAGRYRVLDEISGDVVSIGHIARGIASG